MEKNKGLSRSSLIAALLAAAVIIPRSSLASEELDRIAKSTIQEGVAAVACGDQRLIGLSGLDYDACLARSEIVTHSCWDGMQPLLPDLRFGQSDFDEKENQKRVLSTLFVLEKCIQASILLPAAERDGTHNNELGDSKTEIDDLRGVKETGPESDIQWATIIENALSEYAEKRDLVNRISIALAADDLVSVALDGRGGVLAFKKERDGRLSRVSENLQYWKNMLADGNVRSAVIRDDGVVLGVGLETITDMHRIDVAYISGYEPTLPQCTPDFQNIPCGSCEIDRSDDDRAILSWYSREIENSESREEFDGDTINLSDQMSSAIQCWKDGMSQLGFDADSL